jgi:predicted DNA-binding transcriptional regulator AlpA
MNSKDSPSPVGAASGARSQSVSLSPFVNELFPNWEELLTAHEVARLTRRPRWMVFGLALLGRFPRERRFHGRNIGWLRADVIHWLAKDICTAQHTHSAVPARTRCARQGLLPLGFARDPRRIRRRRSYTPIGVRSRKLGARRLRAPEWREP